MKRLHTLLKFLKPDSWGWLGVASLLICAFSGVMLISGYDATKPFETVSTLVIANPEWSFFRNMHYWSGQLFLILTVIHLIEHLLERGETKIRRSGMWFRLSALVIVVVYAMLSGFILKADADALQAQRILAALLSSIPFAGPYLADTLAGSTGNFQLIYLQHAATATIIVFIVVAEHVRSLSVNLKTLVITGLFIGLISFFFRAPLASADSSMMKGPWYFVGLQELLHWTSNPVFVVVGSLILPIMLFMIYFAGARLRRVLLLTAFSGLIIYTLLTIIALFFRGPMWQWQWPFTPGYQNVRLFTPDHINLFQNDSKVVYAGGRPEGCLSCHSGMKGLTDAHNEAFAGCYSCHRGDPYTLNKQLAHKSMVKVPGNLSNAMLTCGSSGCHPGIPDRVNGSLMTLNTGIVSVDRWVFGESPTPDGYQPISGLSHTSAADLHLRNLCAGCHLGSEKQKPGKASWLERGGGCNACHLRYSPAAEAHLHTMPLLKKTNIVPQVHPAIDIQIDNNTCKSCHSRSGRISMNYEGWHEVVGTTPVQPKGAATITLPDGRIFSRQQPDVHHSAGMLCIDCHGSYEIMGDGNSYKHEEEAVKLQCTDCHTQNIKATDLPGKLDRESRMILWLRGADKDTLPVILTENDRKPLTGTRVDKNRNQLTLILKSGKGALAMKPPAPACTQGTAHNRLSCNACHTAWAPQCIGCHNQYESDARGYDMLAKKEVNGSWVELSGEAYAEPPVLGINYKGANGSMGTVDCFIPGMILSIDGGSFTKGEGKDFHRLYAPASPHTTASRGRTCKSCHNNSLAIGYGRGTLTFGKNSQWNFDPLFANNSHDGLPEDAWTGFLKQRTDQAATRLTARPFNVQEQKRILTAGACLTCHEPESKVMVQSLYDFESVKKLRKPVCRIPVW